MAYDPNLILAGNSVDVAGAMGRGNALAAMQLQMQDQNSLRRLYEEQGPQILAGNPAAVNALSRLDPNLAFDAQQSYQTVQANDQTVQANNQNIAMAAAEHAKSVDAETLAKQAAEMESGLKGAAYFHAQGDRQGYDEFLRQNGMDPAQYSFDNFPAVAAQIGGVLDVWKGFMPKQPEWRVATPDEARSYGAVSGQINTDTGKFDAQNPPSGMMIQSDGDGGFTMTQGSGVAGMKLTESQGKNTGFLYRMDESNKTLGELGNQGTSLWNKTAGAVPVLGNYLVGADAQKYAQAQRDFVNAILRRESGAAISAPEFENAKIQYFPQPGDSEEVVAQKMRNRQVAIDGVRAASGPGGNTGPSPDGQASPPPGAGGQAPAGFEDIWYKY